ncbi:hypothetical protein EDEG_01531 [Edhazardia aedis USNM 41457]|uniref:GPI-anchored wall transfer protein 1 n=1 Tax=Edhazardia aedis (strain USNM 41457) TaxID=1003232 RepID=J9D8V0_EDHAE|nr:hypothetical protein EDEG_01531 [Edhazardia aedis USNM 41457]|eukprot:EJW04181.1 hypothetical protein EDEG_01531 [Edhazardia aedis USNM 41457]
MDNNKNKENTESNNNNNTDYKYNNSDNNDNKNNFSIKKHTIIIKNSIKDICQFIINTIKFTNTVRENNKFTSNIMLLLGLGILRTAIIRIFDYQVNITEYGKDMNFYYVLGISLILLKFIIYIIKDMYEFIDFIRDKSHSLYAEYIQDSRFNILRRILDKRGTLKDDSTILKTISVSGETKESHTKDFKNINKVNSNSKNISGSNSVDNIIRADNINANLIYKFHTNNINNNFNYSNNISNKNIIHNNNKYNVLDNLLNRQRFFKLGLVLIVIWELLLKKFNLDHFIFIETNRTSFFTRNKEGFVQLIPSIVLMILSMDLKIIMNLFKASKTIKFTFTKDDSITNKLNNTNNNDIIINKNITVLNINEYKKTLFFLLRKSVIYISMYFIANYDSMVSRRLGNTTYVMWIMSVHTFLLFCAILLAFYLYTYKINHDSLKNIINSCEVNVNSNKYKNFGFNVNVNKKLGYENNTQSDNINNNTKLGINPSIITNKNINRIPKINITKNKKTNILSKSSILTQKTDNISVQKEIHISKNQSKNLSSLTDKKNHKFNTKNKNITEIILDNKITKTATNNLNVGVSTVDTMENSKVVCNNAKHDVNNSIISNSTFKFDNLNSIKKKNINKRTFTSQNQLNIIDNNASNEELTAIEKIILAAGEKKQNKKFSNSLEDNKKEKECDSVNIELINDKINIKNSSIFTDKQLLSINNKASYKCTLNSEITIKNDNCEKNLSNTNNSQEIKPYDKKSENIYLQGNVIQNKNSIKPNPKITKNRIKLTDEITNNHNITKILNKNATASNNNKNVDNIINSVPNLNVLKQSNKHLFTNKNTHEGMRYINNKNILLNELKDYITKDNTIYFNTFKPLILNNFVSKNMMKVFLTSNLIILFINTYFDVSTYSNTKSHIIMMSYLYLSILIPSYLN